jgi:serine/threonine protein kinase
MESIQTILTALSAAVSATTGAVTVGQWLVGYLRQQNRHRKATEVLQWLHNLGSASDGDVRRLVADWQPPTPLSDEVREELILLLTNLVRTSRFHSTQGTPLSSYLRCERLIEQLLANLQPRRRASEAVSPGRPEWKLERFLGMGSFGEVWVGRNRHFPLGRAFKFFTSAEGKDWLKREAEALYQIKSRLEDHPNVIEYHDIAVAAEPFPFLMLEYVGGGSLEDWILAPAAERQHLDVSELIAGIARGLAEAHRHGIYHRDLKPANVLLSGDADLIPKVADFGLSRVEADPTASRSAAVSQAVIVGTRMYLPPEAADPYEERCPAQDDVFALGVVWYQVLTGRIERPPYDFTDQLQKQAADSRTVRLLARCLAHPARRFRDAGELLTALEDDPPPLDWNIPAGCFEVGPLAREYLNTLTS